MLLREHSKHDLTLYKTSTLKRRIERRMGVHGLDSLAAYEHFVQQNPQELDLLFKEMLIGVTSFFRDPEVWQELKSTVLPALLARQQTGEWPAGVGGGLLDRRGGLLAGDRFSGGGRGSRDAPSLDTADLCDRPERRCDCGRARGHYPAKIADDMTPDRLNRFFKRRRRWLPDRQGYSRHGAVSPSTT